MLRLFDCLETDPNTLFRDSFREGGRVPTHSEQQLLEGYRGLSPRGKETVRSVVDALCAYRDEVEESRSGREPRVIPLYRSPAAAGYAAPVFGEDFDYIPVTDDVPQAAEFAVRIQGELILRLCHDTPHALQHGHGFLFFGDSVDFRNKILFGLGADGIIRIQPFFAGHSKTGIFQSLFHSYEITGVHIAGAGTALDCLTGAASIKRDLSCRGEGKVSVLFEQDGAFRGKHSQTGIMLSFIAVVFHCVPSFL